MVQLRLRVTLDVASLTVGLYVDLPGVWALHCHVGWHLSDGKLAAFVYMPDQVKQLPKPADWSEVRCQLFTLQRILSAVMHPLGSQ